MKNEGKFFLELRLGDTTKTVGVKSFRSSKKRLLDLLGARAASNPQNLPVILVFHLLKELFYRRPFQISRGLLVQRLASVGIVLVVVPLWLDDSTSLHFDDLGGQQTHERACRFLFRKRTNGEDVLGSLGAIDAREDEAFLWLEVDPLEPL